MSHPQRKRKPKEPRAKEPCDWLSFLEESLPEMEAALEILRRLRWAVRLSERGLSEAPGPWPGSTTRYNAEVTGQLVDPVLMPEEMVARLQLGELCQLRDDWECEVREWGRGIWERRGDTLRLRSRRHEYRRDIESLRSNPFGFGDPSLTDAAGARIVNRLKAEPGTMISLPNGVGVMRCHAFTDPFGNPLPFDEEQRLLDESEEERVERPEDDRTLRRIVDRTHKKSCGGVGDLDPRLLRPKT